MWCSEWGRVGSFNCNIDPCVYGELPERLYHSETICLIEVWKQHMLLITAVVACVE